MFGIYSFSVAVWMKPKTQIRAWSSKNVSSSIIWYNEMQLILHDLNHIFHICGKASYGEKKIYPQWTFPYIPLKFVHVVSEFWKFHSLTHLTESRNLWLLMLWGLTKFVASQEELHFFMNSDVHRRSCSTFPTCYASWIRESCFLIIVICLHLLHENRFSDWV